jgi:FkbM family methyltransferase
MSTAAEQAAIRKILQACDKPVIVDLGAHLGEDSRWMYDCVADKNPRVIMVEADPDNYNRVLAHWHPRPPAIAIPGAVASYTGTCVFHLCDNDQQQARASGSIRKPTGHLKYFKWCKFDRKQEVLCYRLDDLFHHQGVDHIDVLWVDVQGAERDVIAGGAVALSRSRYMMIESEEVEFYEGQALRPELLALLPGWKVIETFDYNLLLQNEAYV